MGAHSELASPEKHCWQLLVEDPPRAKESPDVSAWPQEFSVGHSVKLVFKMDLLSDRGPWTMTERMWVAVTEKHGDIYVGILESQPHSAAGNPDFILTRFMEIPFKREHVVDYLPREEKFQLLVMSLRPARVWLKHYG
jgi:hypothetical protein